jgi:eukaryotic-like serine/threonine-protein kinase
MSGLPSHFGAYRVVGPLGRGGTSEVYLAVGEPGPGGQRPAVAIKHLHTRFAQAEEYRARLTSEIRALSAVNHPLIVHLLGSGDEQGRPYLVLEYVPGRTLEELLLKLSGMRKKLPAELSAYVVAQVAAGLHHAHQARERTTGRHLELVHRDVCPSSILIGYRGEVKISDFGLVKSNANPVSTRPNVVKGRLAYLSPEQAAGQRLDWRSDIYALGIILWELLTARRLFDPRRPAQTAEELRARMIPPSSVNAKVPPELDAIVLRALAPRREDRFYSAEELAGALTQWLSGLAYRSGPETLAKVCQALFQEQAERERAWIEGAAEGGTASIQLETLPGVGVPQPVKALPLAAPTPVPAAVPAPVPAPVALAAAAAPAPARAAERKVPQVAARPLPLRPAVPPLVSRSAPDSRKIVLDEGSRPWLAYGFVAIGLSFMGYSFWASRNLVTPAPRVPVAVSAPASAPVQAGDLVRAIPEEALKKVMNTGGPHYIRGVAGTHSPDEALQAQ